MAASLVFDLSMFQKDNVKPYVFKDYYNPVTIAGRDIKESLDYNAIENSITNIFLFAKGENILFPDFGNNLYKYLYEPIQPTLLVNIQREIEDIFNRWEPRVKIVNLSITPIPDENTVYVQMIYTVPFINKDKQLTFNIAVRRGGTNA